MFIFLVSPLQFMFRVLQLNMHIYVETTHRANTFLAIITFERSSKKSFVNGIPRTKYAFFYGINREIIPKFL